MIWNIQKQEAKTTPLSCCCTSNESPVLCGMTHCPTERGHSQWDEPLSLWLICAIHTTPWETLCILGLSIRKWKFVRKSTAAVGHLLVGSAFTPHLPQWLILSCPGLCCRFTISSFWGIDHCRPGTQQTSSNFGDALTQSFIAFSLWPLSYLLPHLLLRFNTSA